MAGSLKFLQFFQKCHKIIGICPSQSNQEQRSTNDLIKFIFLFSIAQFMFTMAAFLVFEAKSIFDYGFAMWALLSTINSTVIYLIFSMQLKNTLNFIEKCEEFIEKSKAIK